MRILIKEVASHRNGCFGVPFHAVRFTAEGDLLVGLVFEGEGRVAVLNAELAAETVEFGVNSYRGDVYESALRAAVAAYDEAEEARFLARVHGPALRLVAGGRL